MGYEGHIVGLADRSERAAGVEKSMALLLEAHGDVGGDVVSGGGTGTYDLNTWVTEIQAGSYALMDTAYGALGLPFSQALSVLSTVISSNEEFSVCDAGLKSLGMDHGNPSIEDHEVWFCSDEHVTFSPPEPVGTRIGVVPAHVDPTMAYHATLNVTDGEEVDRAVAHRHAWMVRPQRKGCSDRREPDGESAKRPSPVRYRVLFRRNHLGEGPPVPVGRR